MRSYSFNQWDYDDFSYFGTGSQSQQFGAQEWDDLLRLAIYARWSNEEDKGFNYLGEAYNRHIAKNPEERVKLLFVPSTHSGRVGF